MTALHVRSVVIAQMAARPFTGDTGVSNNPPMTILPRVTTKWHLFKGKLGPKHPIWGRTALNCSRGSDPPHIAVGAVTPPT